ncbi:hypothetical protein SAMN04487818_105318 [Actinokineospora terrae]|uniref:DUF5642 domain-containing protein n=2 Tax=Actinokineospora terrae TaxID=155974 RepID=A0A1H9S7R7_9PSEU|nr:hypothetical protein SAMN04487818_105318 [Actinokineospora terrae]
MRVHLIVSSVTGMRKVLLAVFLVVAGCSTPAAEEPGMVLGEYDLRPVHLVSGDALGEVFPETAGQVLCHALPWGDVVGPVQGSVTVAGACLLRGGDRVVTVRLGGPGLDLGATSVNVTVEPSDSAMEDKVLAALRPVLTAPVDLTGADIVDLPKSERTARLCELTRGAPGEDKCVVGRNEVALTATLQDDSNYADHVGGRPALISGSTVSVRIRPDVPVDLRVSGEGARALAESVVPKLRK